MACNYTCKALSDGVPRVLPQELVPRHPELPAMPRVHLRALGRSRHELRRHPGTGFSRRRRGGVCHMLPAPHTMDKRH